MDKSNSNVNLTSMLTFLLSFSGVNEVTEYDKNFGSATVGPKGTVVVGAGATPSL